MSYLIEPLILVIKGLREVNARVNWTERVNRHFVGDHGIEISRAADSNILNKTWSGKI